jgi:hypothetical protein
MNESGQTANKNGQTRVGEQDQTNKSRQMRAGKCEEVRVKAGEQQRVPPSPLLFLIFI